MRTMRSARDISEILIHGFLICCAGLSVLTTIGVVIVLCRNASFFFSETHVVSNDQAEVIQINDGIQTGQIRTEDRLGEQHVFEINRMHRQDKRTKILVELGQDVEPGQSLAIEPGVSLVEFCTHPKWTAQFASPYFGILPLVCGTVLVALVAGVIAIPIGLGTAIYLSEYATPMVRRIVRPSLDLLAGIPPVVYGYVAVVTISPMIKRAFDSDEPYSALAAALVVAIMILPMIVSLSEDAIRTVPKSLREAAYALGANKYDVTTGVVVPAAISGIVASFLLAISRATGETMAVALAAGLQPKLTLNPLEAVQTMTSYIIAVTEGDSPTGSLSYHAIFAVGLTLFVLTMSMNLIAHVVLERTRRRFE